MESLIQTFKSLLGISARQAEHITTPPLIEAERLESKDRFDGRDDEILQYMKSVSRESKDRRADRRRKWDEEPIIARFRGYTNN